MIFTKEMVDPNHLNFGGDSYMIIDNQTGNDLSIEVFDKDYPSCFFADYISHKAPVNPGNVSRNILQYHDFSKICTYISSYCYPAIKVGGGQTIDLTTTPLVSITVNSQQYIVKKEIRNFDYASTNFHRPAENATNLTQALDPKVAYDNYYYITITKKK